MDPVESKRVYSLGNPFDNIKIIFNTIMGSPRLTFGVSEDSQIIAKTFKDEEVFSVNRNICTDHAYAENMLVKDHISDFAEFGKLFNEFGVGALNLITSSLMISCGNKIPLLESEDVFSIKKLGIVFNKFFKDYQTLIGVKNTNEEGKMYTDNEQHLDFSQFVDDLEYITRNAIKGKSFIEFGDALCSTYVALTIYLTGAFIKISEILGMNINTLYGEGKDFAADDIADKIIKSANLNNDVKYKFISLIYLYYLITKFYQNNLGIDFVDKINYPFYKIGEKISGIGIETLEEEMDISYLFSTVEGVDMFMNILNPPSVVENPTGFDVVLRDNDITDFGTIALPLYKYFSSNAMLHGADLPRTSAFIYDHLIGDKKVTESELDILYNHFIDNVANVIPASISPKFFYKITVYAAAFRKLKSSTSGKAKEIAALGLYQAEGILSLLFREWVKNKSFCREIGTGVCCNDERYVAKSLKAKTYIYLSTQNYINFVHKFEMNDDMFKRDNYGVYASATRILDEVNNSSDDLVGANYAFEDLDIMKYDLPYITFENYEEFDKVVSDINSGKVPLLSLFVIDNEKYGYNYLIEVIETDYQQKTIDQLAAYAENAESDYLSIYDSKLARALTNNIKTVLKNEDAKERFDIYFNTFIKCVIPVVLAKNVFDKTDKSDEDFVGNVKRDEKYLPNIRSQRLFNFLEK